MEGEDMHTHSSLVLPLTSSLPMYHDEQTSILSPMTELSIDMELSSMSTPRRKLSLLDDTRTPRRVNSYAESMESGIETNSPLLECPDLDSPTMENIRAKTVFSKFPSNLRQRLMTRRSFSSPIRKPLEPLNICPESSTTAMFKPVEQAFELLEEKHSDISLCEMSDEFPELDTDFEIKRRPIGGVRSNSAPPLLTEEVMFSNSESPASKIWLSGADDDGFFDEISRECLCSSPGNVPTTFLDLLDGPIVSSEDKENIVPNRIAKLTFQIPMGLPIRRNRSSSFSVKRDNPGENSPISRKKHRSYGRSYSSYDIDPTLKPIEKRLKTNTPKRLLHRSQSFDTHSTKSPSVEITSLFDIDDKKLIGDKSREYCLPIIENKHLDLKGIAPKTLANVLDNMYQDVIDELYIIDCRYPYEYDGGHIKGAINIYEKQETVREFLKIPKIKNGKRIVLVFHCEFSSKRGPEMCRFLRNKDRDIHQHCYPNLYYPEMYLLVGGYKEFFALKKEYCTPQYYQEMIDPKFSNELKSFSKRSKSWSEDKSGRKRTGLRY